MSDVNALTGSQQSRNVAGVEKWLRNAPQVNETFIEPSDLAIEIDDENAVGRRVQRGEEQRMLVVDANGGRRRIDRTKGRECRPVFGQGSSLSRQTSILCFTCFIGILRRRTPQTGVVVPGKWFLIAGRTKSRIVEFWL